MPMSATVPDNEVTLMKSLSMPPAWQGPLPAATPPSDMAVYQLPTGSYETRASFAFKGGSFRDKRSFAATAILVTHPGGDFLVDAGFGAGIAAHVHAQPWFARSPYQATGTASEQLDASGYDRRRLRGVLITHSHWDHVSGLDQLQVPIWTNAGELRYAAEARDGKVFRTVSEGHEIHEYEFGARRISASRRATTCTATARWSSPWPGATQRVP